MSRIRTLLIIGVFILSLAVLIAHEWQKQDPVSTEGQMVTGTLSQPTSAESTPAMPQNVPSSETMPEAKPAAEGILVPLDNGTLRGVSGSSLDVSSPNGVSKHSAETSETPEPSTTSQTTAPTTSPATMEKTTDAGTGVRVAQEERAPLAKPAPLQTQTPPVSTNTPVASSEPVKQIEPKNDQETQKKEDSPLILTAASKPSSKPGSQTILATRVEIGKSIVFKASGDAPLQIKTLLLANPDRYVVDLQGRWSIRIPKIPAGLWLKDIRVGYREDTTRLVFDLARKPTSADAHESGTNMDVILR